MKNDIAELFLPIEWMIRNPSMAIEWPYLFDEFQRPYSTCVRVEIIN
jgi:hypothetical protein